MKKDLTELVFILGRSGLLSGLKSDTIGGYNSLLGKQRNEVGEAIITTVLFDGTKEQEMIRKRYVSTSHKITFHCNYPLSKCKVKFNFIEVPHTF